MSAFIDEIEKQLAWRGPNGGMQGHVVLPRALCLKFMQDREETLTLLKEARKSLLDRMPKELRGAPRAKFTYAHAPDMVVVIDDCDGTSMSITNDAEAVVAFLGPTVNQRVFYRDTDDRWDELVHNKGKFVSFKPITNDDRQRINFLLIEHRGDMKRHDP